MTLKPPRGFCISFQKIESWFDFARTTDHPERPRTESYSEKKSVSPNNIREVSQEKVGPAAHVKALVFTPFGWVGNSRETSFLRLQHISLHISLSALQGIPPWSSTVCPWKFMVGRWRFIEMVHFEGTFVHFQGKTRKPIHLGGAFGGSMILCHLLIGQHLYPEKIKFYPAVHFRQRKGQSSYWRCISSTNHSRFTQRCREDSHKFVGGRWSNYIFMVHVLI